MVIGWHLPWQIGDVLAWTMYQDVFSLIKQYVQRFLLIYWNLDFKRATALRILPFDLASPRIDNS